MLVPSVDGLPIAPVVEPPELNGLPPSVPGMPPVVDPPGTLDVPSMSWLTPQAATPSSSFPAAGAPSVSSS